MGNSEQHWLEFTENRKFVYYYYNFKMNKIASDIMTDVLLYIFFFSIIFLMFLFFSSFFDGVNSIKDFFYDNYISNMLHKPKS